MLKVFMKNANCLKIAPAEMSLDAINILFYD